jgi:hypothetical protein
MNDTDYQQTLVSVADRGSHRGADAVFTAAEAQVDAGMALLDADEGPTGPSTGQRLLVAAIVVLVIAAGVGVLATVRSTRQDVVTGPEPSVAPTRSSMEGLLSLLPGSPAVSADTIELQDFETARRAANIQPPSGSQPAAQIATYERELGEGAGLDLPPPALCADCTKATVGETYRATAAVNGYSVPQIDAYLTASQLSILLGRFDPDVAERALTPAGKVVRRSTYRDAVVLEIVCSNPGQPVNEVLQQSLDEVLVTCALYDTPSIVRVVTAGLIAQVPTVDLAKMILDRQAGVGPSAADDANLRALAVGADTADAYRLEFLAPASARCPGDPSSCGSPYYPAGTTGALGLAREPGHAAASAIYVLSNSAPGAAQKGADAVTAWYTTGKSLVNASPVSARYDTPRSRVDGAVATVVIPMKPTTPASDLQADKAKRDYPAW